MRTMRASKGATSDLHRRSRGRSGVALRRLVSILPPERLEDRRLLTQQFSLGNLTLVGDFTQSISGSNTVETSSTTTPVQIGFTPIGSEAFLPLTNWTGTLSFNTGGSSFTFTGEIDGIESASSPAIAQIGAAQSFTVSDLASTTGSSITGGQSIGVYGASLTPSMLSLINPSLLTTSNAYVSLQGSLGFGELPGLAAPVNSGNAVTLVPSQSTPGITLTAAASTSAFTAFGVEFGPNTLSVAYSSSASAFQIYGSVTMQTSSGDFSAAGTLGTASVPGVIVDSSGDVTELNLTVTSAMTIAGLAVTAAGVELDYQVSSTDNSYEIVSGSVTVGTTSDPVYFQGTFGQSATTTSAAVAGLVLTGTNLTSVDITVSSSMTIAGLSMTASGLQFVYSQGATATTGLFEIAEGSVTVGASTDPLYFQGIFGTAATSTTAAVPGLEMTGSTLTGVDITISSSMTVAGMSLQVSDLAFVYQNNSSTAFGGAYNGDYVIGIGASVTFSTSAGDTTFVATFGSTTDDLPGLVISDGSIQNLYATVTTSISAQGLTLSVDSLLFQYVALDDYFDIGSGAVSISSGSIQFATASFVTVDNNPGFEIADGVLQSLNIEIDGSLTVDGMSLSISNLQFDYAAVTGQTFGNFEIAAGGTVTLSAGSSNTLSFSGTFGAGSGSTATPGLVINDGVLQSFYIAITSSMSLGGLNLSTTGLAFSYVSTSQTFEIPSGSVSVTDTNGDFSFTGTFGTTSGSTTSPGLVVDGNSADSTYGTLTALNVTVTSQFIASSVTFNVTDLNFVYSAAGNEYIISTGTLAFDTAEEYSFTATLSLPSPTDSSQTLPGLVIQNGAITEFNAALTTSFTVAGLQIGVTNMAMNYSGSEFAMYGTVSVSTNGISFIGTIGDPTSFTYGLYISNDVLESLAISINSTVDFGSLAMTATGLSFNYAAASASSAALFSLYGTVSVSVAGVSLTGNLGTSALPGLTIVNGSLTELNLGVTADFTLFGLTCDINDLTFQYYISGNTQEYIMFGSLSVVVGQPGSTSSSSDETISANLGTQADPGMILTVSGSNTTVQQINMVIDGSFSISGFGFAITDAGLDYTNTSGSTSYSIFGTFTLNSVFTATVQLGTGSTNPGIVITNGNFYLENFAFSLDNVPIGAFTLNYLNISYTSTGNVWSGSAQVTFPTGFALGASMTFDNGALADIGISYSAGTSSGIAIADTGMFITGMSAELENLNQPQNIVVSGSIDAVFGKQITIAGQSCSLFAATGSFTADSQELVIQGDYYEGAYEINNQWQGILGNGSAGVTLDWAAGVYSANVTETLYDGIFEISAEVAFDDSGNLGIIATASVIIPDGVPFIGGTKLGTMGFAFIYTASSGVGTVAAWATVNLGFCNVTSGFQYTFDSKSSQDGGLEIIGASQVNGLSNEVNSIASADASTPPIYTYTYTVVIPNTATGEYGLSVQASWPTNSGTQQLLISGPNDTSANGSLNYYSATATSLSSTTLPSNDYYSFQTISSTSQSVMVVGSATTTNGTTTASTTIPLTPGTYTFEVESSYEFASGSDITWSQQIYYTAPSVAIASVPTQALSFVPSMTGFAASQLQANTTVTLYADANSSGYQGKQVGSFAFQANSSGALTNVPYIDLSAFSPGVPIYIYAVINDSTNTPVYSAYSAPVIPEPDIVGQVVDQFGNPLPGLTVFLDLNGNGIYDTANLNSTSTTTEPSAVTNASGYYYFSGLESYTATDVGYPNFLVDVQMPTPSFTPITPSAISSTNPSNPVVSSTTVTINVEATSGNPASSQIANFSVSRLASISGSIFSDIPQNGVYVSTDPALNGATVYIDSTGSGTYNSGDPTVVTGPSGLYSFYGLSVPDVGNYSFEMPSLTAGTYQAQPTGTGADWTFSTGAGIASNGSSLTSGNSSAPSGTQVGYLQNAATISQSISGFQAGLSYYITVSAATEAGLAASQFTVSYNGTVIGTFSPTTGYQTFTTSSFVPGAGSITLTFAGVDPSNTTETTFLDNVQILPVTTYTVGILNSTTSRTPTINGTNQYVVTFPISGTTSNGATGTSAGTWTVPVPSDAPQFTNVNFGAITLATVSGTVTATSGSTSTLQSGTLVNLSTPITTVSSPSYTTFASTSGLVLNGSSAPGHGSLTLFSTTQTNAKTSTWFNTALPVTGGFTTTFQYSMTGASATGAGFAFVLQNNANTTATKGNAYFGYGGMADSLAVIFDATNNELLIESDGDDSTTTPIASLTSGELGFSLSSGAIYSVTISYTPSATAGTGTLSIYLNASGSSGATPALSALTPLATYLNLGSAANVYCGFTAGTSTSGLAVSLDSWSLTSQSTTMVTTNSSGQYTFTGLMPGTSYTVTQVVPAGEVQSSPLSSVGIYSQISLATLGEIASSITTGDFNGDGIPDVAYALSLNSNSPFQIAYAYGNNSGGFSAPVIVTIPVPTSLAPTLATPGTFGAFDAHIVAGYFVNTGTTTRDDIAYIATMANGGNAVVIYDIYTGTVVDSIEVESVVDPLGSSAAIEGSLSTINNIVVGDLNNQGYDDIVTSTYGGVWTLALQNLSPSSSWVVNPSTLETPIGLPSLSGTGAVGYNAGVALADFNQDGNLDIATVGVQYQPGTIFSGGSYQSTWTSFTVLTTFEIYYGNGSGVTYSTSGLYTTDTGTVSTSTTQQTFQSFTTADTYLSSGTAAPQYPLPIGIAAGDISGDGIPDLEFSAYNASLQPDVFLLTQSGPDTFVISDQISVPGGESFNVYTSAGSNGTSILPSSYFSSQISAVDLNSDGFTDIAEIDPNIGQLFILTTSAAALTSGYDSNTFALANGSLSQFAVADFANDGYPDFVIASPSSAIPVQVLNGTMNVGYYSYTLINGQILSSANFTDLQFTSSVTPSVVSFANAQNGVSTAVVGQSNTIIFGRVYRDVNLNQKLSTNDPALAGVRVYLDLDNNGRFDPAVDQSTLTDASGSYSFSHLQPGKTYTVRVVEPAGMQEAGAQYVTPGSHATTTLVERDFGLKLLWTTGQTSFVVDPLAPTTIQMAPSYSLMEYGVQAYYKLTGQIPAGMIINSRTGEITWTAPANLGGLSVDVQVEVENLADPNHHVMSQVIHIAVNTVAPDDSYIRSVYGAVLSRVPAPSELQYWAPKLGAIGLPGFVSAVLHSNEYFTDVVTASYRQVLARGPSQNELTAGIALMEQGGSSDQLVRSLLTSSEFVSKHRRNGDFVRAVNQILIPNGVSAATLRKEATYLSMGMSRKRLVQSIQHSKAASQQLVNSLTNLYVGHPASSTDYTRWVSQLMKGKLNTQGLTAQILLSSAFIQNSTQGNIPNLAPATSGTSVQYNQLNNLTFVLTGKTASRAQLDALEVQLAEGRGRNKLGAIVYGGRDAEVYRIQSVFETLLHRKADARELGDILAHLPADNLSEATAKYVLGGTEFRGQFGNDTDYISNTRSRSSIRAFRCRSLLIRLRRRKLG